MVKGKDFGLWHTQAGIPNLLPASCVAVDKSPNLSEHQLPPLQIMTNNSTYLKKGMRVKWRLVGIASALASGAHSPEGKTDQSPTQSGQDWDVVT